MSDQIKCFACNEEKFEEGEEQRYYLPICDECKEKFSVDDFESEPFWNVCSFCEEKDIKNKGTVYRSLVVCCDCYVEPVKLREEWKKELSKLKIKWEECNKWRERLKEESKCLERRQKLLVGFERLSLLTAYSLIMFSIYAVLHNEHLGVDCFFCRWRWLIVMIGAVSFSWVISIKNDEK